MITLTTRTVATAPIAIAVIAALALLLSVPPARGSLALTATAEQEGTRLIAEDTSQTANDVSLQLDGDNYAIVDGAGIAIAPPDCTVLSGELVLCPRTDYVQVEVRTGRGNDRVVTRGTFSTDPVAPLSFIVSLGSGRDSFRGGDGDDHARGGPGRDSLRGGQGGDLLFGGKGRDELRGGAGRDILFGSSGNDRLFGGIGRDFLIAGPGHDFINAGRGRKETISGGPGRDLCIGKRGDRAGGCEKRRPARR